MKSRALVVRVKTLLSIILVLATVITSAPSTVFAAKLMDVDAGTVEHQHSGIEDLPGYGSTSTDLILVKGQKYTVSKGQLTTSSKKVVTVNNKGLIVAKGAGTSLVSNSTTGQSYNITVLAPAFSTKKTTLVIGESKQLSLENTGSLDVSWTSSNIKVSKVADGVITAVGIGSCKVSGWVNGKQYTTSVTVKNTYPAPAKDSTSITIASLQSVKPKFSDKSFNTSKALWETTDSSVATVKNGTITGLNSGKATISGSYNGISKSLTVTVKSLASSSIIYVNEGKSVAIKLYKVNNNKADWDTSDSSILTVKKGKVTGVKPGYTTVSCTYNNVKFSIPVYVESTSLVTDEYLQKASKSNTYTLSLKLGQKYLIQGTQIYQELTWKSSKSTVAFIDENSLVKGKQAGKSVLTTKLNGQTLRINVVVSSDTATDISEPEGHDYSYKTVIIVAATADHEGKIKHICKCGAFYIETTPKLDTDISGNTVKYYTITFDANGGSFVNASRTIRSISENSRYGELPQVTKESSSTGTAYTFAGWYNGSELVTADTLATSDATIVAKWTESSYCTVNFDTDGGKITSGDSTIIVAPGQEIGDLPVAEKEDAQDGTTYTFDGWYSGTRRLLPSTVITKSFTAKAHWVTNCTYTVIFDINGGEIETGKGTEAVIASGRPISTVLSDLPSATKSGYEFSGWNDSADGSGMYYTVDSIITADTVLYAQYIIPADISCNYTVNYYIQNQNSGTTHTSSNYSLFNSITTSVKQGTTVTPEVKVINGYTSPQSKTTKICHSSTVIDYYYTLASYSVTLSSNKGIESSTGAGTYKYGSTVTLTSTSKKGFGAAEYTSTGVSIVGSKFKMPASDIVVNIDAHELAYTTYTVDYEIQNKELTGYTTYKKNKFIVAPYESVTPSVFEIAGYDTPEAQTIEVQPDGSTVITYKYDRKTYTVDVQAGDHIVTNDKHYEAKFGQLVTLSGQAKDGYKLTTVEGKGEDGNGYSYGYSFNMPATNLTLTEYADLISSGTSTYTVTYSDKDNNILEVPASQVYVTVSHDYITPTTPVIPGYIVNTYVAKDSDGRIISVDYVLTPTTYTLSITAGTGVNSVSGSGTYSYNDPVVVSAEAKPGYELTGIIDSSNSSYASEFSMPAENLSLQATATPITYTINYDLADGELDSAPTHYTVDEAVSIPDPTREGYDFAGWTGSKTGSGISTSVGDTGDINLVATWKESNHVKYTVYHQKENLDGTFTTAKQEVLYGTTNAIVKPDTMNYKGFTSPSVKSAVIKANGTTSIYYNYTRNTYTVQVYAGDNVNSVGGEGEYKYEQQVRLTAVPIDGYTVNKWSGNVDSATFNMPAYDVQVTASAAIAGSVSVNEWATGYIDDDTSTLYVTSFSHNVSDNGANMPWYDKRDSIKHIIISYGVTQIDTYAFDGCSNLESVVIPDTVDTIADGAFRNCSALSKFDSIDSEGNIISNTTGYTFPICDYLTTIGDAAFSCCDKIASIYDGNDNYGLNIGKRAFISCNGLTTINLQGEIDTVGEETFKDCKALSSVDMEVLYDMANRMFENCAVLNTASLVGETKIADEAFKGCSSLASFSFHPDITYIGTESFLGTKLTSIMLPRCVTISNNAFKDITALKEIKINDNYGDVEVSTDRLGSGAFSGCTSLATIDLPSTVINIENNAFYRCTSLKSIVAPESLQTLGGYAFAECSKLTTVSLNGKLQLINNNAFEDCNLREIDIPASVRTISDNAFYNNYMTTVTIHKGIQSIGNNVFSHVSRLYYIGTESDWNKVNKTSNWASSTGSIIFNLDTTNTIKISNLGNYSGGKYKLYGSFDSYSTAKAATTESYYLGILTSVENSGTAGYYNLTLKRDNSNTYTSAYDGNAYVVAISSNGI